MEIPSFGLGFQGFWIRRLARRVFSPFVLHCVKNFLSYLSCLGQSRKQSEPPVLGGVNCSFNTLKPMQQYSEPPLHHANKHQGNLSEQNAEQNSDDVGRAAGGKINGWYIHLWQTSPVYIHADTNKHTQELEQHHFTACTRVGSSGVELFRRLSSMPLWPLMLFWWERTKRQKNPPESAVKWAERSFRT